MQFSDKLINKLKTEGTFDLVKNYIFEKTFVGKIIYYVTDWRYRSQSRNLNLWIINNSLLPNEVREHIEDWKSLSNKKKVEKCLRFVNAKITYITDDKSTWKVPEYWQTPEETWKLKQGDCEDGSILLYAMLNYLGIKDTDLFIVTGDVNGGGHCYIIWINPDDMQEYAIDWCYWFTTSVRLNTPYQIRGLYYHGTKEWFRFNKSGSWTHRRLKNW